MCIVYWKSLRNFISADTSWEVLYICFERLQHFLITENKQTNKPLNIIKSILIVYVALSFHGPNIRTSTGDSIYAVLTFTQYCLWLGILNEGCDFTIPICFLHYINGTKIILGKTHWEKWQTGHGKMFKGVAIWEKWQCYNGFLGYHLSTEPKYLIAVHSWTTTTSKQEWINFVQFTFKWDRPKPCTSLFPVDQITCGDWYIHCTFVCPVWLCSFKVYTKQTIYVKNL